MLYLQSLPCTAQSAKQRARAAGTIASLSFSQDNRQQALRVPSPLAIVGGITAMYVAPIGVLPILLGEARCLGILPAKR